MILVDKPASVTSHDVVGRARRALGIGRVGHSGTLDPMATGLLVLGVGWATRLLRFTDSATKTYDAGVALGVETDTWDADGEVVATVPVVVSPEAVRAALSEFVGDLAQVPPMHAAIKVGGEKLYDKARRGEQVEREPRAVTVHGLDVTGIDGDQVHFTLSCSAGTYVRSIAHDLGAALGCGAHLCALRRTAIGPHRVADALSLDELGEAGRDALRPPLDLVAHLPRFEVDADDAARVMSGRRIEGVGAGTAPVAVVACEGVRLLAVYEGGRATVTAPN
ncbi:MAG: tRNA pseudouridine(55) synthase TruB [Acidimicrobiia bacterium]